MNSYKIFIKSIFQQFLLRKTTLLAVFFYSVIMLIGLINQAKWGDGISEIGFFDLLVDLNGALGGMNHLMFIFLAIPVIAIVLTQLIDWNEVSIRVLSYGSRFRSFHAQIISALLLSFVLTVMLFLLACIIAGTFAGQENTWLSASGTISSALGDQEKFRMISNNISATKILITILLSKFLAFTMISFFVLFLRQFIQRSPIIIMVLLLLAGIDQSGYIQVPIFTWNGALTIHNWLEPALTFYRSIYMIVISLILYGVTGWLYERKDFYK